jgi:hypothetical protein
MVYPAITENAGMEGDMSGNAEMPLFPDEPMTPSSSAR